MVMQETKLKMYKSDKYHLDWNGGVIVNVMLQTENVKE